MDTKVAIQKLNIENYFVWKFKMKMILTKEKVWTVVTSSCPLTTWQTSELEAWNDKDAIAKALIVLSLEDNQLSIIMDKSTAKETWDALKEYHEKSSAVNRMTLMRNMFDTKMIEGSKIEAHIDKMSNYLHKLKSFGINAFDDELLKVSLLLSSLPESYRTLVTTLEGRSDEITWLMATSKLIDESKRREYENEQRKTKLVRYFGKKRNQTK